MCMDKWSWHIMVSVFSERCYTNTKVIVLTQKFPNLPCKRRMYIKITCIAELSTWFVISDVGTILCRRPFIEFHDLRPLLSKWDACDQGQGMIQSNHSQCFVLNTSEQLQSNSAAQWRWFPGIILFFIWYPYNTSINLLLAMLYIIWLILLIVWVCPNLRKHIGHIIMHFSYQIHRTSRDNHPVIHVHVCLMFSPKPYSPPSGIGALI